MSRRIFRVSISAFLLGRMLWAWLLLLIVTVPTCAAIDPVAESDTYNIGFFPYIFGGAPENDARAAFKTWVQVIGLESGMQVRSTSQIFKDSNVALAAIAAREIDILTFSSVDYLEMKPRLPPGLIMSPIRRTGQQEQYLLICHRDSPGQSLADFKDHILLRQSRATALLGGLWLESELHKAGLPSSRQFFRDISTLSKPAKVLLPVYFKQADLCMVTSGAYETLCEMNPQISKQVRIIARSQPLISTLVWLALPPESRLHAKAHTAIANLDKTPSGRQTLLLFQFSRIQDCPDALLDSTRELLLSLPASVGRPGDYLRNEP